MTAHVLIIDDNPTNLQLATEILEDAGWRVAQAADAEQALGMLDHFTPDLILMDFALPGMDGLTLTRRLKANPRFQRVPIVALTASAMKGDEEKALAAGCHGYITKPIDTRRFAHAIAAFLPAANTSAARAPAAAAQVILIADDYPSNRLVLRAGLESEGVTVLEAANGVEALAVLEREHVDAVISDILMPSMDGFRLCHEIRKSGKTYASVPFILYTATYNSPSDRELAKTVGADDYVLKPAPVAEIVDALRRAKLQTTDAGRLSPKRSADSYVLEQYSAALVHKLEEKNADLHEALSTLRSANERISELNQHLEARVAQRTAALEAANQSLDSFSHSVAHDLRTPLSHISVSAELLREKAGGSLDARCQEHLDTIISATDRMGQLIKDLLAYSRSSRDELKPAAVSLDTALQQALDVVQPEAAGRSVEWRRGALPTVQGDLAMLRQVFVNLLSNALKYSRTRESAVVEIGEHRGAQHEVAVFVRDNGVGFDAARAGELFKVFRRLHADSEFEGTGIGLASARQIIERHGGRMWAEAVAGQGATFYFSLPRAAPGLN